MGEHGAVTVQDTSVGELPWPLPLRLDLRNHSPTGAGWGYMGSGPNQLALALLADALGDDDRALRLYRQFTWRIIQGLPMDGGWAMSDSVIKRLAYICERALSKVVAA